MWHNILDKAQTRRFDVFLDFTSIWANIWQFDDNLGKTNFAKTIVFYWKKIRVISHHILSRFYGDIFPRHVPSFPMIYNTIVLCCENLSLMYIYPFCSSPSRMWHFCHGCDIFVMDVTFLSRMWLSQMWHFRSYCVTLAK